MTVMPSKSKLYQLNNTLLSALGVGCLHLLGISLIAVIGFAPFVTQDTLTLYFEALSNPTFANATLIDMLLHFGLSASLWALGYILFQLWTLQRKAALNVVRVARGAVMLETLIILVPFLLLTSGIAQMTILNISGVLAHLASYQATRTAWVWQPEANKGRKSADNSLVERRARLAAAAVMAPAAPADFIVSSSGGDQELQDFRGTMTGSFTDAFADDSGKDGKSKASQYLAGGTAANSTDMVFVSAFDKSIFPRRAARKLTMAYASTAVTVSDSGDTISTRLVYKQNIVFPWFAYIWGEPGTVAGRKGYYTTLTYNFSMPSQVDL